jgi:1D-myo-inositol 3-kinase
MCHPMENTTAQVLVAGNYCHDTLIGAEGRHEVLGGSASYISAVLTALEVRYRVVSKVGTDFKYGSQLSHAPLVAEDAPTTHFVDDFTSGRRVGHLQAECAPIRPEDLGETSVDIAIACGVAREILPETLFELKAKSRVLIADIQGLIRTRTGSGQIKNLRLSDTPFIDLVDAIDYLKIGEEELAYVDLAALSKRTHLLITLGSNGCRLLGKGQGIALPAPPTQEVDSSGAGDCFVAGFTYGLLKGLSAGDALKWGNRFGALAVGQVGIPDFKQLSSNPNFILQ